jgi:hypothetical protein
MAVYPPLLRGKVAIVSGANAGLGLETTKALLQVRVWLVDVRARWPAARALCTHAAAARARVAPAAARARIHHTQPRACPLPPVLACSKEPPWSWPAAPWWAVMAHAARTCMHAARAAPAARGGVQAAGPGSARTPHALATRARARAVAATRRAQEHGHVARGAILAERRNHGPVGGARRRLVVLHLDLERFAAIRCAGAADDGLCARARTRVRAAGSSDAA